MLKVQKALSLIGAVETDSPTHSVFSELREFAKRLRLGEARIRAF
jgi:hypothetical protein